MKFSAIIVYTLLDCYILEWTQIKYGATSNSSSLLLWYIGQEIALLISGYYRWSTVWNWGKSRMERGKICRLEYRSEDCVAIESTDRINIISQVRTDERIWKRLYFQKQRYVITTWYVSWLDKFVNNSFYLHNKFTPNITVVERDSVTPFSSENIYSTIWKKYGLLNVMRMTIGFMYHFESSTGQPSQAWSVLLILIIHVLLESWIFMPT